MDNWRQRLHVPNTVDQLRQPLFSQAVTTACEVLRPSLASDQASSASLLVIGPPASGKSLLTRLVVKKLQDDIICSPRQLVVIQLTGLIHSTPSRAWQQLSQELFMWYEASLRGSAETVDARMKNAAAELLNGSDTEMQDVSRYQDAVQPALRRIKKTGSALLLVLDELHRFVNADPLAQTVLYSLLNLLQDQSLKAACVAQTTHIDVTDLLEKRVLSRLSHRKIVVPLPDSPQNVIDFISTALLPPSVRPVRPSRRRGRGNSRSPARGASRGGRLSETSYVADIPDATFGVVVELLLQQDTFKERVKRQLARTRVIAPLLRAVDAALSLTEVEDGDGKRNPSLIVKEALSIMQDALRESDASYEAIMSLTQVQLALLIALRRVESARVATKKREGADGFDKTSRIVFLDVYTEYRKLGRMDEGRLAELDVSQSVVELPVAQRAWELLIESGIVVRTGAGPRDGRPIYCAVAAAQVDNAIDKHSGSSTVLKNWAKRAVSKC